MQWLADLIWDKIILQDPEFVAAVNAANITNGVSSGRNPATADFDFDDLTFNGNFHELDLSGIVPVGTRLITARIFASSTQADDFFFIRTKGFENFPTRATIITQVANRLIQMDKIFYINTERKLEYMTSGLSGWTEGTITIVTFTM